MTDTAGQPDADEIFRPLPDGLRTVIDGLPPCPPDAYPSLPDWARSLIFNNSQFAVSLVDLEQFAETDGGNLTLAYEGCVLELSPGGTANAFTATPKTPAETDWMLPAIYSYWDERVSAIAHLSDRLRELPPAEAESTLDAIRKSVTEHANFLSDGALTTAAVSFIDDLYKAACAIEVWDESVRQYLEASAGTFSRLLSERGLTIQYLVDNLWEDTSRPFDLFPSWYRAAGIRYLCPQQVAHTLIEDGTIESSGDPQTDLDETLTLVRDSFDGAIATLQEERSHFVQLDIDSVEASFQQAMELRGSPGVLTLGRVEAATPGSKIQVWHPEGSGPGSSPA